MKLLPKYRKQLSCKWVSHKNRDNSTIKIPCLFTEREELVYSVYFFSLDLLAQPKYSVNSIPTYVENIRGFLNYVLDTEDVGNLSVDEAICLIGVFQIDDYFIALQRAEKKTTYISAIDANLKTFFDWLEGNANQIFQSEFKNPYKNGRYRTSRPKTVFFKGIINENLRAFLTSELLPRAYKLALLFALCSGVRRKELCELEISSLKKAELVGDKYLVELDVVNAKERGGLRTYRKVIIPWKLYDYLLKHVDDNQSEHYVFTNARGDSLTKAALSVMIWRVSKELEGSGTTNDRITPHKFRHTFAFKFISYNEGHYSFPVQIELSKLLGHSSLRSLGSYTHIPLVRLQTDRRMNMDKGFSDLYDELNEIISLVLDEKTN